ncbi:hypothetical protein [Nocardia puris]|uniref:Uncharacterized protein n=1 Tax=Nocardia puris TaxID=208602 RepID=A0A366DMH8_9NOCA|nr:hypothetical protein [Nocardia puris]RBO91307.1 hypothetical protein DFR74_1049 [Nocardia puris]
MTEKFDPDGSLKLLRKRLEEWARQVPSSTRGPDPYYGEPECPQWWHLAQVLEGHRAQEISSRAAMRLARELIQRHYVDHPIWSRSARGAMVISAWNGDWWEYGSPIPELGTLPGPLWVVSSNAPGYMPADTDPLRVHVSGEADAGVLARHLADLMIRDGEAQEDEFPDSADDLGGWASDCAVVESLRPGGSMLTDISFSLARAIAAGEMFSYVVNWSGDSVSYFATPVADEDDEVCSDEACDYCFVDSPAVDELAHDAA